MSPFAVMGPSSALYGAMIMGCAFFDTVAAMGGVGSARVWSRRNPALAAPDLKHLTMRGRDLIGQMIYDALVAGYEAHQAAGR